jgi:peroxiredoxin
MDILIIGLIVLAAIGGAIWLWLRLQTGRPVPAVIQVGQPLPDFASHDEQGNPVRSTELHGAPAVILFVRGSWCPFCNSQVKDLTRYYKDIIDRGARLILITPKPLETTRRVAEFFEVEFDFWLDESLEIAKQLGLVNAAGVPKRHQNEYGDDTVWPTTIVTNPAGIISFVRLSKHAADRPDPKVLLQAISEQTR